MMQVPEDIRKFTELNTLVYHKFFSTDAVAGELEVNVFLTNDNLPGSSRGEFQSM